jgi:hypothetical protein
MKKLHRLYFLPILFLLFSASAQQQKQLKKTLELKVVREGGANGAGVVWNPGSKKYYAGLAGNSSFFMGVYDNKGQLLSPIEQQTYFDLRGLWYNATTRTIQANGYSDAGWAEYILDSKGMPTDVKILHKDMHQPGEHSVGTFNTKDNVILFLNEEGFVERYDIADGLYLDNVELKLGKTAMDADEADNAEVLEDYNSSTAIYTGISGAEIGLLNFTKRQIELYDIKNGNMTRRLALPDDSPIPGFLNFAYCNGIYWLFDKPARIWMGYK